MREENVNIKFHLGDSYSELPGGLQNLIKETVSFAGNAYAPYSNFRVSACLQLSKGQIIKGTNVENASYPVSICAERTLLSHTVANYPDEIIETVAIYVDKALGKPVPPCGLCRQTLLEVELRQKSPIRILLLGKEGNFIMLHKASDLLPLSFDGEYLRKGN